MTECHIIRYVRNDITSCMIEFWANIDKIKYLSTQFEYKKIAPAKEIHSRLSPSENKFDIT